MSVTIYDQPKPAARAWLQLQNPALELANAIASTDFVPQAMRGNPAAITACILYGDEIGLGPMQSLAKISMINGRPTLSAEGQRAKILQEGHDVWIEESTITKCTVAGRRKNSDSISRVTWTMDDAKRANLAGKPPWRLYPRQMLLARASAELARAVFADAIGGLAATEEMDDEAIASAPASNGPAVVPELQPPPAKRKRRANVTASPATADAPKEEEEKPPPEPEPPPPEPEEIDEATMKRLMMLFRERGFVESEQRHAFTSFMLGRRIDSSKELGADDAAQMIQILEQEPSVRPARPPDER